MTRLAWSLILLIALAIVVGVVVYPRLESTPPEIEITGGFDPAQRLDLGLAPLGVDVRIRDTGRGVRSFVVEVEGAGGETRTLAQQAYPGDVAFGATRIGGVETASFELKTSELSLPDGPATLVLRAADFSLRDNQTELRIDFRIDTRQPKIRADLPPTVARGGSALARYTVDEETSRDGLRIGHTEFRGFPISPGSRERVAYFSIPVDAAIGARTTIFARDFAGNETTQRGDVRVLAKSFGEETLDLDEAFLARVADRFGDQPGVDPSNLVNAFRQVNEVIRAANEQQIREALAAAPVEERLWNGAFLQLPGSKVMSRFAERRHYRVRGEEISVVRHYGFDLASTRQARIPAANAGRVAFAGPLGIYGNCVLVDHGQGLASLYGHLSSIDVEVGQDVARGDVLGRSGATGLAGGDHLHFAILVNGTYVDPIEWWDPRWIETRIDDRLDE